MNAAFFIKTKTRTCACTYLHLQRWTSLNIHTNTNTTALSSQLSSFFKSYLFVFSAVNTHSHLSGYTLLLPSLWCLCFLSDCIISTCGPPVCSCLHAYASSLVIYTRQSWCQAQIFFCLLVSDQIIQQSKVTFEILRQCKATSPWSLWKGIFEALLYTVVAMTKTVKRKVEIRKETVDITNQKLQFEELFIQGLSQLTGGKIKMWFSIKGHIRTIIYYLTSFCPLLCLVNYIRVALLEWRWHSLFSCMV